MFDYVMHTETVCSLSPQQVIDELGRRNSISTITTDLTPIVKQIQATKETVGPLEMVLQLAEEVKE